MTHSSDESQKRPLDTADVKKMLPLSQVYRVVLWRLIDFSNKKAPRRN